MFTKLVAIGEKITHPIAWVFHNIGAFLVFFMAAVILVDVFARYFFNSPIRHVQEVMEFALLGIVF